MIDIFLKSDTAEELDAALEAAGLIDSEGTPTANVDIDRIGEISRVVGYDEGDEPIIENHPGYHVNLRTGFDLEPDAMSELAPFKIDPSGAPFRVWG